MYMCENHGKNVFPVQDLRKTALAAWLIGPDAVTWSIEASNNRQKNAAFSTYCLVYLLKKV